MYEWIIIICLIKANLVEIIKMTSNNTQPRRPLFQEIFLYVIKIKF